MTNDSGHSEQGSTPQGMTPREKAHFKFAMILIFSCMFALPVIGAIWILLMQWGIIPRP